MCCGSVPCSFRTAGVFLFLGVLVNAVGFLSPFWSDRTGDYEGLWHVCGGGSCTLTINNDATSTRWFIANQILQTVGAALALTSVVSSFIVGCFCCACVQCLVAIVAIKVLLAGALLTAGVILYGVVIGVYYEGVKFLFAYWMTVGAAALYLLAGVLYGISVPRHGKDDSGNDDESAG